MLKKRDLLHLVAHYEKNIQLNVDDIHHFNMSQKSNLKFNLQVYNINKQ